MPFSEDVLIWPHALVVRARQHTFSDDFVAHPEATNVVVLVEGIHDLLEPLQLRLVPLRVILLDLRVERVQVQPDIDAGILKRLHAIIVVRGRVNVIDAYRIGAESLHELGVARTLLVVDKRVIGHELVGDS